MIKIEKKKLDDDYIDFGEWLYNLRKEKGLSEEELVEQIGMTNVQIRDIRKWERSLDFPDIDQIYKLSEIYRIPSAEIIDKKQQTLQAGLNGIHEYIIRTISLFLGISVYGTIILSKTVLYIILILVVIWFYLKTKGI